MYPVFTYDWSVRGALFQASKNALVPAVLGLLLGGGHIFAPTFIGPRGLDVLTGFMAGPLFYFMALCALLSISLAALSPIGTRFFRLCRTFNLMVMGVLFPLFSAMFGVGFGLLPALYFSGQNDEVGIIAGGMVVFGITLTAVFWFGQVIFTSGIDLFHSKVESTRKRDFLKFLRWLSFVSVFYIGWHLYVAVRP